MAWNHCSAWKWKVREGANLWMFLGKPFIHEAQQERADLHFPQYSAQNLKNYCNQLFTFRGLSDHLPELIKNFFSFQLSRCTWVLKIPLPSALKHQRSAVICRMWWREYSSSGTHVFLGAAGTGGRHTPLSLPVTRICFILKDKYFNLTKITGLKAQTHQWKIVISVSREFTWYLRWYSALISPLTLWWQYLNKYA